MVETHEHQHEQHERHGAGLDTMAVSATLHCLTGCAIGEIAGMLIGTAAGVGNAVTVPLSIALAFVFGFTLSSLPLLRAGLDVGAALKVVVAADTLSILTMEVVDNLVMVLVPGAMDAGLVNVVFWLSMALSLAVAFAAAFPVNRALLRRGKGHALTHEYHDGAQEPQGARRFIPAIPTGSLVAVIAAFLLGGLVVAIADALS
ncbi:MAG TPA: DUF4396 domain-containing protein [Nocardioides sp.]|nr:DUF4396 domain-containing protein [Nocardioides sp.]